VFLKSLCSIQNDSPTPKTQESKIMFVYIYKAWNKNRTNVESRFYDLGIGKSELGLYGAIFRAYVDFIIRLQAAQK